MYIQIEKRQLESPGIVITTIIAVFIIFTLLCIICSLSCKNNRKKSSPKVASNTETRIVQTVESTNCSPALGIVQTVECTNCSPALANVASFQELPFHFPDFVSPPTPPPPYVREI